MNKMREGGGVSRGEHKAASPAPRTSVGLGQILHERAISI